LSISSAKTILHTHFQKNPFCLDSILISIPLGFHFVREFKLENENVLVCLGGSSFGLWKFKIDGNEGSWGFVIWVYASSAISKKNVVKASGSCCIVCGVRMRFW
jgi:hypothetical protein